MVASSTIFYVFGMTRPGIEPKSPGPLQELQIYIILVIRKKIYRK